MNYLRLAILLAAFAQCSYADSIPTFHITEASMYMLPNEAGDNVSFIFTGPGVEIIGLGGMCPEHWCTGLPVSDPIGYPSKVYITNYYTAIIGGKSYDPFSLLLSPFDDYGGLLPLVSGTEFTDTDIFQFNMTFPTGGGWSFNFAPTVDQDGNPAFYFVDGSFRATAPLPTPEPATVGLMLIGLAGIAGKVKRKAKFRH